MEGKLKNLFSKLKSAPEIQANIDISNMHIGLVISICMFLMEGIVFLLSFFPSFGVTSGQVSSQWLMGHRIAYGIVLLSSAGLFLVSLRFVLHKDVSHRIIRITLYSFVLLSYAFGVYVSIMDFYAGNQVYTFLTISAVIPSLFYLSPVLSCILTCSSFTIVFQVISAYVKKGMSSGTFSFTDIFNISAFAIFMITICVTRYVERLRTAKVEVDIQKANKNLHDLSYFDALTKLKNRYALREDYDGYVNQNVFVMMTDIDDFKFFNDNFGHNVGDEILKALADALNVAFSREYCYRFGGDEFLMIIPECDETSFKNSIIAWRATYAGVVVDGETLKSSCSCGYIYGKPECQADLRRMIQLADGQLYEAKRRGKNCEVGKSYINALLENTGENIYTRTESKETGTDQLTGLSTMMYFRNKAWLMIHNQAVEKEKLCFVYFNIVNFKSFNEIHGFTEGDRLLVDLSELLKKTFSGSLVSRFAEDQFVVLTYLQEVEKKINYVSDRIYNKWNKRIKAGVYNSSDIDLDVSSACDRAKLACESIKSIHGTTVKFFDSELRSRVEKKMYVIEHFEEALEEGDIKLLFQPVVEAGSRKRCYAEALARWNDSRYGDIDPSEFIKILEDAHLIYKLDLFALEEIAVNYSRLSLEEKRNFVPVSLNISWLDFVLCNMHELIDGIMTKYEMPKDLVCFEVKESEFQQNQDMLNMELSMLRENGFQIWLDDFGLGYLPLNILDECRFDIIKVDVRFLGQFYNSHKLKMIISQIVRIAEELNIKILARGVETEDQFEMYRNLGCSFIQGYLISNPLTVEEYFQG